MGRASFTVGGDLFPPKIAAYDRWLVSRLLIESEIYLTSTVCIAKKCMFCKEIP